MKKFYIYEVKGIKNGCTNEWDRRYEQNLKKYNITPILVETYEYPNTAEYWQILGDREWELAELNGYPKGTHYRVAREKRIVGAKVRAEQLTKSGDWYKISQIGNTKENRQKARESFKKTAIEKGLHKGEKNPRAKLNESDVAKIRMIYESGETTNKAKLGRLFGVTDSMIRYIVQYKNWN